MFFRVHEDRSFHCDVCGVCLDVKLLENHICRPGSAHDQCCICFEVSEIYTCTVSSTFANQNWIKLN